jgi:hypothetical protein
MLVFAANLKEIEEVGCRGMDGDEVFVGFRCRCRKVEDFEIFWSLVWSVVKFVGYQTRDVP